MTKPRPAPPPGPLSPPLGPLSPPPGPQSPPPGPQWCTVDHSGVQWWLQCGLQWCTVVATVWAIVGPQWSHSGPQWGHSGPQWSHSGDTVELQGGHSADAAPGPIPRGSTRVRTMSRTHTTRVPLPSHHPTVLLHCRSLPSQYTQSRCQNVRNPEKHARGVLKKTSVGV